MISAIAGAGLLVIAVIAAIVIISGVWVQTQLTSSPSTTVEDFYSAIHQQDYATAYGRFSSAAQGQLSVAKFTQTMRATDLIAGGVQSYTIVSATTNGQTATVTVDVVRQGNSSIAQVFQLTLTQEQQTWRIASIKQTGQTSAPTPSN
jgi:VCBS repeat-containing protein